LIYHLRWRKIGGLNIKFGENAGKIWITLNEKGPLSKQELLKNTQLKESDFQIGIGWLARENKVNITDEDLYKLDDTNLTPKIGSDAGKVYKILDIWGKVNFTTIKKLAKIDGKDVYSALGWLAKENKIEIDKKKRYNIKK